MYIKFVKYNVYYYRILYLRSVIYGMQYCKIYFNNLYLIKTGILVVVLYSNYCS